MGVPRARAGLVAAVTELRPRRRALPADVGAGVTLAVALLPDGMAAAVLAGVNPVHGLFAAMFGPVVGALTTGSTFMTVTATAALALGVGEALRGRASVAALVTLTVLVGLFQVAAGVLRLGRLTRYVSAAVMTGFLTGLGVLIVLGQLGDVTGFESGAGSRLARLFDLVRHPGGIDPATGLVAAVTIAAIAGLERTRLRPLAMVAPLVVVTIALHLLDWRSVRLVGDVPRAVPSPTLPSPRLVFDLVLPALGLAVIGMVQGAGVSDANPNPGDRSASTSRDFVGQGVANLVCGLFRGLPVGGSMSATAVGVGAGASSRWAHLIAGLLAGAAALALGGVVGRLPLAALGGLLVLAGFRVIDIRRFLTVIRTGWPSALVTLITLIATLALPLQRAVAVGVGVSFLLHVFRSVEKVALREIVMTGGLPEERPPPRELPSDSVTVLLPYGSLFFAAAHALADALPRVGEARRPVVLLLLRGRQDLGVTFIRVITRYARALRANAGQLMLVGASEQVVRQLRRTGALDVIGAGNVFAASSRYGEAFLLAHEAAESRLRP
jgi:sulfate permease, SulP family